MRRNFLGNHALAISHTATAVACIVGVQGLLVGAPFGYTYPVAVAYDRRKVADDDRKVLVSTPEKGYHAVLYVPALDPPETCRLEIRRLVRIRVDRQHASDFDRAPGTLDRQVEPVR